MIRVRLSRLMGDKRINMTQLANATGIARTSIFALYHEKAARIDLVTLDRLCTFFQVEPGDLLQWEPGPREQQKK